MSDKNKMPTFSIGPKAKREVRKALMSGSNPIEAIGEYQKTRSLHSMFAKAFGTTPYYAADDVDTSTSNETRGYASVTTKNDNSAKKKNIVRVLCVAEQMKIMPLSGSSKSFLGTLGRTMSSCGYGLKY